MDSPSAQLVDTSVFDIRGPPSSPFLADAETTSHSPSKQPEPTMDEYYTQNTTSHSIRESYHKTGIVDSENKENSPERDATLAKLFASPKKTAGHAPQSDNNVTLTTDFDASLMPPPPSARKNVVTPRKMPLASSRSGARTPHILRHDESATPSVRTPATLRRDASATTDEAGTVDDTCFSTFSEAPNMATYARMDQSPSEQSDVFRTPRADFGPTPRSSRKRRSVSRSPSPTPRSRRLRTSAVASQDNITGFLIDFTQQMEGLSSYRPRSPAKSSTESNLLQYINNQRSPNKTPRPSYSTPGKQSNLLSLLDFELPPAPTPRSVPTITVRELESIKSSYMSQISNLKATLSGREAEAESLKKAVGDAERRAGEAQEALVEEQSRREQNEEEKQGWEKRCLEVEQVLRSVKEEVIKGEAEKEDMALRLEDAERRIEDAEAKAAKAEDRCSDMLATTQHDIQAAGDVVDVEAKVQQLVSAQIDAKIEAVSRELHAVYKEKHERKVATLKKSYEARAEKKVNELQARISVLEQENTELQNTKQDLTWSPAKTTAGILSGDTAELKAQLEQQKAQVALLQGQLETTNAQQAQLELELQQERIEKGDLVAAVDEMLALQSENPLPPTPGTNSVQGAKEMVQDFRKSISRPAIAAPASQSKIGRGTPAASSLGRSISGSSSTATLATNSAISGGKSRILANIERMGRTASKDGSTGF